MFSSVEFQHAGTSWANSFAKDRAHLGCQFDSMVLKAPSVAEFSFGTFAADTVTTVTPASIANAC